jgi:hypothetical protein
MRLSIAVFAATILAAFPLRAAQAQGQSTSPAALPRVMTITGVFQPADGQPPRPVETLTLAIYADAVGGAPLWQELQTVALDATGAYTVLLGATRPDGLPADVLAAGAEWLGLRFDRPGETEGPRLRLTSVPYALRAADADTLGGRPASAYLLAPASPATGGAGQTTAATPTASSTTAGAAPTASANALLTGTPNYLAKYVSTTDVGPAAALYETAGGSVGLGTTTPLDLFHVRYTNTNGGLTGFAVQNLGNTATSYSGMLFYDQNGALGQFQGFNNVTHEYRINNIAQTSGLFNGSINFMIGSTSRFLVTAPGNIGIGTTAPTALLEVSNALIPTSAVANLAATSFGANSFGSEFAGRKARGTPAAPTAAQNGDALAIFGGKGYGATNFGPFSSGLSVQANENWTDTAQGTMLNFTTTLNGTTQPVPRMWIINNGNVGIGTQFGAGAVLEVSNATNAAPFGNILTSSFTGTNGGGSLVVGRKARGTSAAPTAALNGDILVGFLGSGYGATTFSGTRGGMFVQAAENWTDTAQGTRLFFNTTAIGTTGPSTKMTIDSSGNVGIGTSNPQAPLEVSRIGTDVPVVATTYTNGTNASSFFVTQTARGTAAAPTAVQAGDLLGAFGTSGYGTTSFNDVFAAIAGFAAENFTDTARGSALAFGSTPLGTKDINVAMALLPSGNLGIGTPLDVNGIPTATDKLQVFGDVRVGNAGTNGCVKNFAGTQLTGTCVSDRRYKKNITPFGSVLNQLSALQPVHYYWRATEFPEQHFGNAQAYGLIAQDVEQVLPELVVTNPDGYKAIDYSQLPLLTIQAVKELKAENDALKAQSAALKAQNDQLVDRIAAIERLIQDVHPTAQR